jgi:hypothetical protein
MSSTVVKLPRLTNSEAKIDQNNDKSNPYRTSKHIKWPDKSKEYDLKDIDDLLIDRANKKEIATILQAIRIGYLIFPSRNFVWSLFEKQPDYDLKQNQILVKYLPKYTSRSAKIYENDFSKILFLNLCYVPIIEIGDVNLCTNLRILNLSNNYLVDVEPLDKCVNLIRLDLQNNQVILHKKRYFILPFF